MRIQFSVGVYQTKREGTEAWWSLTPSLASARGEGDVKLRDQLVAQLRDELRRVPPWRQELYQLPLGSELVRLPIELKLDAGRVTGMLPLIAEPRWTSRHRQRLLVYHPLRRAYWFLADDPDELAVLAPVYFRHAWADVEETEHVAHYLSNGKDRLTTIAFSTEPQSLLDLLPSRKKDPRARTTGPRIERVLRSLAVDETVKATNTEPRLGVPRSPYRERLGYLLGGPRPRSVAVIGPPGAGKTSLIQQWIADRLVEDGYPLHKNADRVVHVWRLTGKRLIAGMSYLGQWEERCLAVLDEARRERAILWIEDLHLFGRLGQSRGSERSFADFFRGPLRRGDLAIVAELTPEQHARLERDAPGLAEALAPVAVPAASAVETSQLLLHEVRALETRLPVALHPFVPRTALELGAALFPWRARPGVAIELLRRATELGSRRGQTDILPSEVLEYIAQTTGLSRELISLDQPLDADEVEAAFAARVIGQPVATRAAADTVLKVRAGLADPGRPINVMLFTGPTGTGKTELATAIAEYLYGGGERLLRIDMGELSGPDAVARLIGDQWNPDGLLTSRVRAQPFCVVLLDEIEKAHPQALHLLLQLFDEGRLTDAAGEVASFASAVVIMTSNLGSRNAAPIGFGETRDRILADVARAVREFFPVELFNRIDRVVPFAPLTPEVAARVVDKELAKLLARRGLRERNTFVYAGAAVRRRAVADAFDPRYGARTVKRWLEDQIGGALTDLLASAPPARLRIVRLSEDAGQVIASLEPMQEKTAVPGPYLLEGALDLATAGLEQPIGAREPERAASVIDRAIAALARIEASPLLAEAREVAQGELRYYVEELGQRLSALGELFGVVEALPAADDDDHDEPMYVRRTVRRPSGDSETYRVRMRGPQGAARPRRPPASRDALIAGIAEALLIERALPELLDPDAHAITVIIGRIGATADASGVAIAASALAQPGWLDGAAALDASGELAEVPAEQFATQRARIPLPAGLAELARAVSEQMAFQVAVDQARAASRGSSRSLDLSRARDIALVLRGLFVRAALAGDHGTWMIRAAAAEPDVVRVDIRSGASRKPLDVLRAHADARAELERVLEVGGPLPPNPDALLPVTRTLTYRAPLRPGEPYSVEIEDFATGWVDRGTARDLASAIRRAWHLAWSRVP